MKRKEAEKFLPLIKAFSEGRAIEYKSVNEWVETSEPNWVTDTEYRIKSQQKLIPFTFEDNLLFKDKWFKYKDGAFRRSLKLVAYDGDCVTIHNQSFSYQKFLDNYIFEDGSSCGKYINE